MLSDQPRQAGVLAILRFQGQTAYRLSPFVRPRESWIREQCVDDQLRRVGGASGDRRRPRLHRNWHQHETPTRTAAIAGRARVISMHGDYRYDALKNTALDVQQQEAALRAELLHELQDYDLVV